jgi:hypothetical protein
VTDQPFYVAVCGSQPCRLGRDLGLLDQLAAVVRRCRHGVLIRADCLLGMSRCASDDAAREAGSYLVVQPYARDWRPRGPAIAVGPVLTRDDVETVVTWLENGELEAELLARRLRVEVVGRRT